MAEQPVAAKPACLAAQHLKTAQSREPVDLTVAAGERVGILGSKGSGKGALLQTLARLKRPKAGRIIWHGVDVSRRPRWLLGGLQHHVLMIWANPYALFGDESRVQDVLGRSKGPAAPATSAAYGGAPPLGTVLMGDLSAAARVQVALAYARRRPAQVILIDDLFTTLSPTVWPAILDDLAQLAGPSRSLVIASQYRLPMTCVDTIYVMLDGDIVERGTREELLAHPRHPYTRWLLSRTSMHPVSTYDWEERAAL